MNFKSNRISITRDVRALAAALCLTVLFAVVSLAQQPATAAVVAESAPAESVEQMSDRIRKMEAQLLLMQAELDRLKRSIAPKSSAPDAEIGGQSPSAAIQKAPLPSAAVSTQKAQTPQKQIGRDLGTVRLTPYGTVYFNAFNNSRAVNNQDVPLFATPSGQGGASASARQTRLGLRFDGAKVGSAKLSGVIEADFFGGFANTTIGENFGIVRIRLANARLDWEKTSVTVGQDWMPFAPVSPTSLAAAAIPQLAAAGNNWARIPQVRVDHKLTSSLTLTGAVLAPQTGDHPSASTFFLQPNTGAASRLPFFQSRLAYAGKNWLGSGKAGSVGFSGHYGRSRVISPTIVDIDSYGLALDWNFPLHKRVSLAGEAFFGRDLAGFQAGVYQGINTDFVYRFGNVVGPAHARGIASEGGWTQIGFTPAVLGDRWSIYGSIGIDDPRDADLASASRINFRSRNLAYAANTIFKVTPQFSLGAEVRRFETSYVNTGKRLSEHFNLSAAYSF